MKKRYIVVFIVVLITGCDMGGNSSYTIEEKIENPYTPLSQDELVNPASLNLIDDYESEKFDTIRYLSTLQEKVECIVNEMRALPIECSDSQNETGPANCIVWDDSLADAAKRETDTIASLDDESYESAEAKELASSSGYHGNYVLKTKVVFDYDSEDINKILTKIVEEALKGNEGSCSTLMDKKAEDLGLSFTTKVVDGKRRVYSTIFLGDSRE